MFSAKIRGEAEVKRNMDAYVRYMDIEVQSAIEDVTELIVKKAQSLAPVDTGKLRSSIQAVVRKAAGDLIEGHVEAIVPYASFVEFGTEFQKAQPFLAPAIEEGIKILSTKLKDAHIRAARRLKSN